jgi:hypothetical protein
MAIGLTTIKSKTMKGLSWPRQEELSRKRPRLPAVVELVISSKVLALIVEKSATPASLPKAIDVRMPGAQSLRLC